MTPNEIKGFINRIQKDPIWFNRQLWPDEPSWDKQEEIIWSVWKHKYTAVRSGNGVGKSHTAARVVLDFLYANPNSKVVTTAPTWDQVEKILWAEIRRHYGLSKYHLGGELIQTELNLGPEWRAFGLSTNQATRFLGHHAQSILVVMDEASGVSDEIDQATKSLLTSSGAKILKIGNPVEPSGHFYECFTKNKALWNCISVSCYDSPNVMAGKELIPGLVTSEWIEEREREFGKDSPWFECFVNGNFPAQAADALISLLWVENCIKNKVVPNGIVAGGVDVARFGSDETVFALYNNGDISIHDRYQGQDLMTTAGKVKIFSDTYKCQVGIDDTGLGGGVTDRARETGVNVFPFIAGEKPLRYGRAANRTTEAWWGLREAIREGNIHLPDNPDLISQLTARKYKIESDGQIRLESKQDAKGRGLKSPDLADAVAIANYTSQFAVPISQPKPNPDIIETMRKKGLKMTQGGRL